MAHADLPPEVKVIETGIGGMSLVQELMLGYDALLIVDAYKSGRDPGQLSMLEPVLPDLSSLDPHQLRDYFSDTHYATPMRALNFLDHIGTLPGTMRVLGCEPEELDGLSIGLSPATLASVDKAVAEIVAWINDFLASDTTARRAAV